MTRISDKLAHLAFTRLASGERATHVANHPVEGCTKLANLSAFVCVGDPGNQGNVSTIQWQLGDFTGRASNPVERGKRATDEPTADQAGEH